MDKLVQKFPYKKMLYLQWFEAAIAHLLLFKFLKQKSSNNIYFLISEQGILLKASNCNLLRSAEEQIDKFFTAKIQQLQISASSDFYQKILQDIKEQTDRLKDTRDCPYVNLVYSQKLKHACLAMKKFGYSKPYENWELNERERRGFCYLIVRPEHRWKQIANNVLSLVKKRQSHVQKNQVDNSWPIDLSYQKFVWLYLRPQFIDLKKNVEVKQKKGQSLITIVIKKQIQQFLDIQKQLQGLSFIYRDNGSQIYWKRPKINKHLQLSSLQIEKITELIYHQYGLPTLVRELRMKTQHFLLIASNDQINNITNLNEPEYSLPFREQITKINQTEVTFLYKLGKRHEIVSYEGANYVCVTFDLPLKSNITKMLKVRLPSLPRYFYWYTQAKYLKLLRRYHSTKFRNALEKQDVVGQVTLMQSLILILQQLHRKSIQIGGQFTDCIYVQGYRIIIESKETSSKQQDSSQLIILLREWVKNLPRSQLRCSLEKLTEPNQMLDVLQTYLTEHCI